MPNLKKKLKPIINNNILIMVTVLTSQAVFSNTKNKKN